jgi:hypothetical protein
VPDSLEEDEELPPAPVPTQTIPHNKFRLCDFEDEHVKAALVAAIDHIQGHTVAYMPYPTAAQIVRLIMWAWKKGKIIAEITDDENSSDDKATLNEKNRNSFYPMTNKIYRAARSCT